jgi:hypothetical protein
MGSKDRIDTRIPEREPIFKPKPQPDAATQAEAFRQEQREKVQEAYQQRFQERSALDQIFRTPFNGRALVRCEANIKTLTSWPHPHESISVEWLTKVLTEQPNLAASLAWDKYETPEQHQAATAQAQEEDRKTFALACRQFSLAENEANYRMVVEALASGFSLFDIEQAIRNGLGLLQASQEQAGIWAEETAQERQSYLINRATPAELRAAAQVEAETNRVAQKQAEDARVLQAAKESGYPPLPEFFQGQQLDKKFLWLCSKETTKFLFQRYGQRQLEARVRGLA